MNRKHAIPVAIGLGLVAGALAMLGKAVQAAEAADARMFGQSGMRRRA